jgi:hypothetical protein
MLVEGAVKSCEVALKPPQARGVNPKVLRLRSLCGGFLLKLCETLFVVKDPLRVLELSFEMTFSVAILEIRIDVIKRLHHPEVIYRLLAHNKCVRRSVQPSQ